jgi:hypothetical protein
MVIHDMGCSTGSKILCLVSSLDKILMKEEIDLIKYICTDYWKFIFKTGVEKVKRDSQG